MAATGRVWLYRCAGAQHGDLLADWQALAAQTPGLRLVQAVDGGALRAWLPQGAAGLAADQLPAGTQVLALDGLLDVPGASAGADAPWHYVVETDVLPAYEHEFNAWYAQEHLPGLAGVPGTVHTLRLQDRQGSPRYHACYDLRTEDTLGSPAWLAVRATPWSSRIRAAFRNTRRTMYRCIAPLPR